MGGSDRALGMTNEVVQCWLVVGSVPCDALAAWATVISGISIFLTLLVTAHQISRQNETEKRKSAADFIARMVTDGEYHKAVSTLNSMFLERRLNDREYLRRLAAGSNITERERSDREILRYLLNYYEVLAISVFRRALDEEVVYDYARGIVRANHDRMKLFIVQVREHSNNPEIAGNFERLAHRWCRKPRFKTGFARMGQELNDP